MSSIFRRILQRFMKPTYFVGRDLEGNKYYEYPNANGRPKRIVQYKRKDDMWTYIASGKRLPVQWNAWLTHTRRHSPSIEELRTDLVRQHRVQMNAAVLEAREQEERERTAGLAQLSSSQMAKPQSGSEKEPEQMNPQVDIQFNGLVIPVRDPWAEAKKSPEEPQSWNPVVRRK